MCDFSQAGVFLPTATAAIFELAPRPVAGRTDGRNGVVSMLTVAADRHDQKLKSASAQNFWSEYAAGASWPL